MGAKKILKERMPLYALKKDSLPFVQYELTNSVYHIDRLVAKRWFRVKLGHLVMRESDLIILWKESIPF